jgi:predicted AlkP superfamily pyrophosphatase or phosphodiesterase
LGAGNENEKWLTAEPFWSVTEDNNIKSAIYFWPESEAKGHTPPSYNIPYNKSTSNKTIIEQLIAWLKLASNQRPHFIASYFSTIDSAVHNYGLESLQLISAIKEFDELFGCFLDRITNEINQPVNIILVSDHGMVPIKEQIKVFTSLILKNINLKTEYISVAYSDAQVFIYFDENKVDNKTRINIKNKLQSNRLVNKKGYSIYAKENYPQHWHFNSNLAVIPDIIIEATPPGTFSWKKKLIKFHAATHGFDPKNNIRLNGFFIAAGPNITQDGVLEPFENIHVFPLMNTVLGLEDNKEIDGQQLILESIIK